MIQMSHLGVLWSDFEKTTHLGWLVMLGLWKLLCSLWQCGRPSQTHKVLRAARLQNGIAPETFLLIRKIVWKHEQGSEKQPAMSPKHFQALSCCLKIFHRHFSTKRSLPKICTIKFFFIATICHAKKWELETVSANRVAVINPISMSQYGLDTETHYRPWKLHESPNPAWKPSLDWPASADLISKTPLVRTPFPRPLASTSRRATTTTQTDIWCDIFIALVLLRFSLPQWERHFRCGI